MRADLAPLAQHFRNFGAHEVPDDALYTAMCRIVAEQPAMLELLRDAAPRQQRPTLWLAAVHDLLLAGVAHPLAAYYASLGGTRAPDSALAGTLGDFARQHRDALMQRMSTRTTQTNEVNRCALLWPALHTIARRGGDRPLALLDLGCSAGLNLGVDHYRYADDGGVPAADADAPMLSCRWVGSLRPEAGRRPHIVQRLGIDPAPVDLHDEAAVRWLRACLWPCDVQRMQRFDRAAAIARRRHWPMRQVDDCTVAIEPWLDSLPPGAQPVVFNSWVLAYFDPQALQRHVHVLHALVRDRGLTWLSAEPPEVRIGEIEVAPPQEADEEAAHDTSWILCSARNGEPHAELLARSHPHARHARWLVRD